jgi:hypothetical protein
MSTYIYPAPQTTIPGVATEATLAELNARLAGSLTPVEFDEIVTTYVGATTDIDTVTYKLATVTVRTLVLGYDGSNRLISVVAS